MIEKITSEIGTVDTHDASLPVGAFMSEYGLPVRYEVLRKLATIAIRLDSDSTSSL
jgi:hypothetical protein